MMEAEENSEGPISTPALSRNHVEARSVLPKELLPAFDALIEDYRFNAPLNYGIRFVSYLILGDLVRAGWRLAPPIGK